MAAVKLLCDTGPLAAFLNRADQFHRWAREQFGRIHQPLLTCEAVISETVFLLHEAGLRADPVFEMIARGKLVGGFVAAEHWVDLRHLIGKYQDQPMSFADACLVRMSELFDECQVMTTDSQFGIYRRTGRRMIPVLWPFD